MARTKTCSRCGKTKPLSEFHRRSSSRDGHMGICKTCRSEQQAERYRTSTYVQEDLRRRRQEERRELAWYRRMYPQEGKPWND